MQQESYNIRIHVLWSHATHVSLNKIMETKSLQICICIRVNLVREPYCTMAAMSQGVLRFTSNRFLVRRISSSNAEYMLDTPFGFSFDFFTNWFAIFNLQYLTEMSSLSYQRLQNRFQMSHSTDNVMQSISSPISGIFDRFLRLQPEREVQLKTPHTTIQYVDFHLI